MPVSRDMLLSELRDLLRLTAFEQVVATVRRSQAADSSVAQELAANAEKSRERQSLLQQAVRNLGGVPDLVGPLVGRVTALLQTTVNQAQTLQGALLGDLALEHTLRERTRYARTLAVSLGEVSVLPVLDRLDSAHTATIQWLEQRLAEVGRTGTSALRPTPVQTVVGGVRRVYGAPFVLAAGGVNRLGGVLGRLASQAPQAAESAASTAASTAASAGSDVIDLTTRATDRAADAAAAAAGRAADTAGTFVDGAADVLGTATRRATDAASSTAGTARDTATQVADRAADTATSVADRAADTATSVADRAADTATSVAEQAAPAPEARPPFPGYDRLPGDTVMRHVADSDDVAELRALLAYEQSRKARKGVLRAVHERLDQLRTS